LENTRDKIVVKKTSRIDHSPKPDRNIRYGFWQIADFFSLLVATFGILKTSER